MKRVTIQFDLPDDTNQNDFKSWVKSCPYSPDSGQQLKWENIPDQEPAKEAAAPEEGDVEQGQADQA